MNRGAAEGPLGGVARSVVESLADDTRAGPKHMAVYEAFRAAIESGHLPLGTRLPADNTLADMLPVSLATLQKALRRLADDGLLVRRHRRGTFVYDSPVSEAEIRHLRFIAGEDETLLPAYVRVLDIDLVANDGEWAHRFGGERELIRLDRVCNINFEFDVVLETYLPARRFGSLRSMSPRELDRMSLAHYLDRRLGAPTLRLQHRFRAGPLTEPLCALVGLKPGSLGLVWQTFVHSRDDELIMLQVAYAPPADRWLMV